MKKTEIDKKFDEFWEEIPPKRSAEEKESSWKKFNRANLKTEKTKRFTFIKYAAAILIMVILGSNYYLENHSKQEIAEIINISNPGNQTKLIFLPDSSEIRLQPKSKITYPKNYISKREISLQGNAFFKVKKDQDHPFKVYNNSTTTTVLGTSFTVMENKEETTVKLYEGKIKMDIEGKKESWILSPGEEFSYNSGTPKISHFKPYVDFEKKNIKNILDFLENEYAYKIYIPKGYLNKKTTLRIKQHEDIETSLKIIAEIHNLTYKIDRTQQKAILKK